MINHIAIKGYKSIKDLKIKLNPINILIGGNGAGKSNFVSFFEFLNRLYDQKLKEYIALAGGDEKILHKGSKITSEMYSKLTFGANGYSFKLKKGNEGFVFTSEGLWYNGNPYIENPIEISDFGTEAKVKYSNAGQRAFYIKAYLNSFRKYHFHDTSKSSPFTKVSHIENDVFFLYEMGENLAAFLYNIRFKQPIVYKRIVKIIQSVAPYFSDFYLIPNENGFVRLNWQDKYSSTVYGVNDLSDGTIRFIALTTLFMQPNLPESIIIDEPELGLHPFAIGKLAGMISSAASKGCQVIVATQSTDLISHFQPEDIITVDLINGESQFKRLDRESISLWLEEYTVDDLWKRNIIQGGQPQ